MKKYIQVGNIKDLEAPETKNGMVIAGRMKDQLWLQNVQHDPAIKIYFDVDAGELVIRAKINNGEFLAIKDLPGIAEKGFIK